MIAFGAACMQKYPSGKKRAAFEMVVAISEIQQTLPRWKREMCALIIEPHQSTSYLHANGIYLHNKTTKI